MENQLQPEQEGAGRSEAQAEAEAPMHKDRLLSVSIFLSAVILAGAWVYAARLKGAALGPTGTAFVAETGIHGTNASSKEETVLPVQWGDLGKQLVATGVIDRDQFEAVYQSRGGLKETERMLFTATGNGALTINAENASVLLNLLWALGIGNKNAILENGPMMDSQYGGAANFASTGGWTIAQGDPMNHYSRHAFVTLTPAQQSLVERVSKNIYRPCCNNSTYFPDCNHGMAMLGLLELMAAQGVTENEMYRAALAVNSYWFPDVYDTIAWYFAAKGISWDKVDPQEALGAEYSSGKGFQRIQSLVPAAPQKGGGGGCGVEQEQPQQKAPQGGGGGCGV